LRGYAVAQLRGEFLPRNRVTAQPRNPFRELPMAQRAQRGDTVAVHYRGTFSDGTEFDTSAGSDPISFTLGAGEVVPGFETAVEGMNVGDRKTETIAAANAYGERQEELVFSVPRNQMPPGTDVEIGDMLRIGFPDGSSANVQIAGLDDDSVTLDANHPLAGKDLTFELELVSIE
jgi:peptidylprolyl isomerase